jgi:hypothetical protein
MPDQCPMSGRNGDLWANIRIIYSLPLQATVQQAFSDEFE